MTDPQPVIESASQTISLPSATDSPARKPVSDLIDETGEFLKSGFIEVFNTVLGLTAEPVELRDFRKDAHMLVAGSVGFAGEANGAVYVYVTEPFARVLVGRMLGLSEAEIDKDEIVNDVIAELSNMIVGSAKSRLCDGGYPCHLSHPSVVRGEYLTAEPACSSECRLFSMACGQETILLELLM